jgi:dTDP-glucose 4,6-dehydratase
MTDEVYGSRGPQGKFTEWTPWHPNNPYVTSKVSPDLVVLAYHHICGFPIVTARCPDNLGTCRFPEKVIPLMIINAISDSPFPDKGHGQNVRNWIHGDDRCGSIDSTVIDGRME